MIRIKDLHFGYGGTPVFGGLSLEVPKGGRMLLAGANGTGKSTLLRLIAGRHLLARETLLVGGRSPFHEHAPGVALVDGDFPLNVDIKVRELLEGSASKRTRDLLELLGVDPAWRMCHVSEGQRRRVQLLLGLRKPMKVLLLDEVTSNLDIVVRSDVLGWLKSESVQRGLTVVFATHILDGLQAARWPTHVGLLRSGGGMKVETFAKATRERTLLAVCEKWIRAEPRALRVRG